MKEEEKDESNELTKENETAEKESRRDKETHVLGVEDLGRHHGLSDPLEPAQPLHHDLVNSTGLLPPAERHQAGPEVVQQAEEDPKKERMKETKNKARKEKRREERNLHHREEHAQRQEQDVSLKKKNEQKERKKKSMLTRSSRPRSSGRQPLAPPPSP